MNPPDSEIRFGQRVVEMGLVTPEQVKECLRDRERFAAQGIQPVPRLEDILLHKGYLTPSQVQATVQIPSKNPSAPVPQGERIGKYVKVTLLGAGGMGEVWKAWDTELGRWVALKFLKSGDAADRERFRLEARTAAKLAHPGIAAVYEAEEGFIAMRFVDGPTLACAPRGDPRRLVEWIGQAALAVHYAHEQGVIHRDLKPANIMVENDRACTERGASEPSRRAIVMDFGLAKSMNVDTSVSQSGVTVGTPAYMSPEQACGRRDIDARTDVYSLGATLYEALAGRPPLHDANVYELLHKVVEEDPPRLRSIDPKIDADLETIVMHCLEKERDRRYATARELAEDLGRWLVGEAIQAHAPSMTYRLGKFISRRKSMLIPTALAAVMALAFAIWIAAGQIGKSRKMKRGLESGAALEESGRWREARDAYKSLVDLDGKNASAREGLDRAETRLRAAEAEEERRRQEGVAREKAEREALNLLERGRPALDHASTYLYSKDARYEELVRRVEQGQALIEEALAKAPQLPLAHHLMGRAWEIKGFEDRAEACWRKAIELDDGFGPAHFQLGRILMVRAFRAAGGSSQGELERHRPLAERLAREAGQEIEAARARGGLDDELQRELAAALLAYCRGDPAGVVRIATAALGKFEKRRGVEEFHWLLALVATPDTQLRELDLAIALRPKFPAALRQRGQAWSARGELDKAFADYSEALGINPNDFIARVDRGNIRLRRNDVSGALEDYNAAIQANPRDSLAFTNRGLALRARGQPDAAIADETEAIRLDPENAAAYVGRGLARHDKQEYAAAVADYTRALEIDPRYPEAFYFRGNSHYRLGNRDEAIHDYTETVRLNARSSRAWYNRGVIRVELGDWEAAIADFGESVKAEPRYADAWTARGRARVAVRDLDGAISDFVKALEVAPRDWPDRPAVEADLAAARRARGQ